MFKMFSRQTKSLAWCCFFRELPSKLQTPSVWSNNENFLNRSRTFLVVFVSSVWFLFTPTNLDKVLKKRFYSFLKHISDFLKGRIYLLAFRWSGIRAMPIMVLCNRLHCLLCWLSIFFVSRFQGWRNTRFILSHKILKFDLMYWLQKKAKIG